MLNLRELEGLVAQRRTSLGKKWQNIHIVRDIYEQLMEGKQLEEDFHCRPEELNELSGWSWGYQSLPNLEYVEYYHQFWYLLKRSGWNKIWRDLLKYYRRGRKHKVPKWKIDKENEEKSRWEARFKKAKDSGNYLSI